MHLLLKLNKYLDSNCSQQFAMYQCGISPCQIYMGKHGEQVTFLQTCVWKLTVRWNDRQKQRWGAEGLGEGQGLGPLVRSQAPNKLTLKGRVHQFKSFSTSIIMSLRLRHCAIYYQLYLANIWWLWKGPLVSWPIWN